MENYWSLNSSKCGQKEKSPSLNTSLMDMNSLPQAVFLCVLSYLDVKDLGRVSCVSKHWYNSALDPSLWRKLKLSKRQKVDDEVLVRVTNYGSSATGGVLDVSECANITEEGLIKALQQCRFLVELSVVRCPAVTDNCLTEIGQSCQNMKFVDISLCRVTDCGVKGLCQGCVKLEKLTMDQCHSLTCESLFAVAQNCPKIKSISVEYNSKCKDAGVCELVQRCPLLERLHLNSCTITSQAALHISQYCRNMSVLDLRYCSSLTDDMVLEVVFGCKYLDILNLSLCSHVTDVSLEHILSNCATLRGLYLVHCKITDDGLEAFSRHLSNLERLDISWCKEVTDEGVKTVLKGCPHLKHLGLVRCDQVNEQTVMQLSQQYPRVFLSTVMTEMNRMCEKAGFPDLLKQ
ncbi:F-box/LRR-repeat protein 17-like [Stylophora pistillata]|uniref:F-box/LRR-repeat protein 17 n=1 Tax=Stylophora pistillata TaxID=50429 RepID=A0A2B4RXT7_STYPI|nr:F-box/LRR-repeat protein 17-like [Stylophora pistillata]PFX21065.1 F-box/LRR-repeat protein 17 [Stylophora pistillata]